jgi:tRNA1(Val) A37 N6-methylase TrmN6
MAAETAAFSEDAVLGGRLVLRQPLRGHRVGHDAMLLAAASSARAGEHAVDLGAGVGGAGLALARRVEDLAVTLVEIDPQLAELGRVNAKRNGLSHRVRSVCLDVGASAAAFAAAGLPPGSAGYVLMNPPFNAPLNVSPNRSRRLAHTAERGTLRQWVRAALRLLEPSGVITLIWRADGLAEVLAAIGEDFGAFSLLPVHPRPGEYAIRVLARAIKGSHASLSLLPGLLLADAEGNPTPQAEAVLRGGAALPMTVG